VTRNGESIIEETTDFWSQRTGEEISPEAAREAMANVVGFFRVLSEWDQHSMELNDSDATCSAGGAGRGQTRTASRTCPD